MLPVINSVRGYISDPKHIAFLGILTLFAEISINHLIINLRKCKFVSGRILHAKKLLPRVVQTLRLIGWRTCRKWRDFWMVHGTMKSWKETRALWCESRILKSRDVLCSHTHTHTYMCTRTYTCTHTHTHVHAYIHMYTHKWHRHVHTHVHAWAHMRTHTYTNVYRYSQQFMVQGNTCILTRYPAGFVYIFSIFYTLTGQGHQLRVAQYMFAVIYLINFALVIRICHKTAKVNYAYVLLECFDCKEAILLSDIIISQLYNP